MTADQFQREVLDILEMCGEIQGQKYVTAKVCLDRATKARTHEDALTWLAITSAVYANAAGYSLETIFQMALDELEAQKKNE
jgi:hypothetical protein